MDRGAIAPLFMAQGFGTAGHGAGEEASSAGGVLAMGDTALAWGVVHGTIVMRLPLVLLTQLSVNY